MPPVAMLLQLVRDTSNSVLGFLYMCILRVADTPMPLCDVLFH